MTNANVESAVLELLSAGATPSEIALHLGVSEDFVSRVGGPESHVVPYCIDDDMPEPSYATADSAGIDLRAVNPGVVAPGDRRLVPTSLSLAIPPGHVGMVCPRSGLALKFGVTVLNAPGIIDADYRGEVGVILQNLGAGHFQWAAGERIAQLVIMRYTRVKLSRAYSLNSTVRGNGAFGSTGVA